MYGNDQHYDVENPGWQKVNEYTKLPITKPVNSDNSNILHFEKDSLSVSGTGQNQLNTVNIATCHWPE